MIAILTLIILTMIIRLESTPLGIFRHHKAAQAYQCEDVTKAQKIYEELISEDINDYQALYNAGKAVYKQKDFVKAESYFNHVACNGAVPLLLRKQAWFDQGNTQVHQKKWQEALSSFKEVIALDEHHKEAQEMIEAITKRIEEEKQAQENQKRNNQKKQKEKNNQGQNKSNQSPTDKNDEQSSGTGDKKDSSDEDQGMKNDQSEKGPDQDDSAGNNQQSVSNKQDQQGDEKQSRNKTDSGQSDDQNTERNGSSNADKPDQNGNKTNNKQGENNNFDNQKGKKEGDTQGNRNEKSGDNAERNNDGTASDKLDSEQRNKKHQDRQEHKASPSQASNSDRNLSLNNNPDSQKEQDGSQFNDKLRSVEDDNEKALEYPDELFSEQEQLLLQMIDNHDAQTSKMLLKEEIKKGMPAQHGYKNW